MKSSKPQFVGQKVKLSDICSIVPGATPKTTVTDYWGGDIKWITPSELNDDSHVIYDTAKHLTEAGFASARLRMFPEGTVLLTTRAPIGKVAIAGEPMCCNQGFKNLVCSDAVNNEYLYRYLKNRSSELQALGRGATFKELSKKEVAAYEINLPPLKRQLEAVEKLALVDKQVVIAKTQLDKLDSLVKSRFVEMFGDPCDANGNKAKVKVASICELRIGPFGSALHKNDYISGGHPLINPSHIIGSSIIPDADLTVSDDKYKSLEAYHLLPGDIVLGRRGEIGRCAVVQDKGFLCGTGSMVLRPRAGVRSEYLQRVVSFPSFRQALERNAVGVTMKNLNAKIVGAADMCLPSINQQDDFISFTKQVDKSRFGGMLHLLNNLSGIMQASFFSITDAD